MRKGGLEPEAEAEKLRVLAGRCGAVWRGVAPVGPLGATGTACSELQAIASSYMPANWAARCGSIECRKAIQPSILRCSR
jgi:hypothetical protein